MPRATSHLTSQLTSTAATERILEALRTSEHAGGEASVTLARGTTLHVSNLDKLFFPGNGVTKGEVMRYYVRVAPYLLPLMRDRALSLKRYPNGIDNKFFFQQKAPPAPPSSVRVETLVSESGEPQQRLIGGSLATLLYCVQLGTIEVNPWNARVHSLPFPDYTVIDLDPGPRTPFTRVIETALWVREALDAEGLRGAVKTSGAHGIHVFIPLPAKTPERDAERVSEHIVRTVARAHSKETTLERAIRARGESRIYLDYGQNARGKTVAAAYSVRPKARAPVSTPLVWDELTPTLDPHAFTVRTFPERLAKVGDIWGVAMRTPNTRRSVTKA